jgi:hypothetical protein
MSWPRSGSPPLRFLLESEARHRASFIVDGPGHEYGKVERE